MPGRILIVEDDRAIVQSLSRLLSREGYFVATAGSAEEATAQVSLDSSYDLALLDVTLPGEDGFSCCRRLRSHGWRQPVIMLTGRTGAQSKIMGLEMGADDYVTKPFDPQELVARIKAQLRRSRDYNAPAEMVENIQVSPDLIIDLMSRDVIVAGHRVHLTEREYELLRLLARSLNAAVEKSWLFQSIWGNAPEMDLKALAVYIHRLRRKVEVNADLPKYVQTVRGYGYKLVSQ